MTAGEHNRGLVLQWGAATDIGPVRSENEDSWLAAPPFFAVADGMGGHLGGARASRTAVQTLCEYLSEERLGDRAADLVDLSEAVEEAGERVNALAGADDAQNAPGTTLTGVLALDTDEGPYWLSLNIGDSRVYVVGNSRISPITHDHSAVQEARDMAEELGTPRSSRRPTSSPRPWAAGSPVPSAPTTPSCPCAKATTPSYALMVSTECSRTCRCARS